MNRHQRRTAAARSRALAADRPRALTQVERERWPEDRLGAPGSHRVSVWESKQYLVQIFGEDEIAIADKTHQVWRITVNRVVLDSTGRFEGDIPWQDLQDIKAAVGFGQFYAVEVYPKDIDVANVQNMRHLWVVNPALPIGWRAYE